MIFRLTQKLCRKIKMGALATAPLHENPYADWSARLFTANRTQYILLCNTPSLYSIIIHGRGITDSSTFLDHAMASIRGGMIKDGLELIYTNFIAPATDAVTFHKSFNRSVIGSMNEFQWHAEDALVSDGVSISGVGRVLNNIPCKPLSTPECSSFAKPREAFKDLNA